MGRIFNFGAGPSMMPLPVLEQAQRELLDYKGSGMSMLEISHRSPLFEEVNDQAQAHIKELLGMDDSWAVMFMGGGATLQFSMIPMNFLTPGKTAAYAITSTFSEKAIKEAQKWGMQWKSTAARPPAWTGYPGRKNWCSRTTAPISISLATALQKAWNTLNIPIRGMCPDRGHVFGYPEPSHPLDKFS